MGCVMAKQDEWSRITLRLPAEIHSQLTDGAGAKSLNAEIVDRLEKSLSPGVMMEFMEMQLDAAKSQLEHAKRQLRTRSMDDLIRNLQLALPPALFDRLEQSAATNGRRLEQELIAALEVAYPPPPPFSLDWFRSEWLTKIAAAPVDQKEALIDQANTILAQNGGFFEIWYSKPQFGPDDPGEVVLSFKNRDERSPEAEYGADDK